MHTARGHGMCREMAHVRREKTKALAFALSVGLPTVSAAFFCGRGWIRSNARSVFISAALLVLPLVAVGHLVSAAMDTLYFRFHVQPGDACGTEGVAADASGRLECMPAQSRSIRDMESNTHRLIQSLAAREAGRACRASASVLLDRARVHTRYLAYVGDKWQNAYKHVRNTTLFSILCCMLAACGIAGYVVYKLVYDRGSRPIENVSVGVTAALAAAALSCLVLACASILFGRCFKRVDARYESLRGLHASIERLVIEDLIDQGVSKNLAEALRTHRSAMPGDPSRVSLKVLGVVLGLTFAGVAAYAAWSSDLLSAMRSVRRSTSTVSGGDASLSLGSGIGSLPASHVLFWCFILSAGSVLISAASFQDMINEFRGN
jgi:hypothetical protein